MFKISGRFHFNDRTWRRWLPRYGLTKMAHELLTFDFHMNDLIGHIKEVANQIIKMKVKGQQLMSHLG